jgi:hypothetical protein
MRLQSLHDLRLVWTSKISKNLSSSCDLHELGNSLF